MSRQKALSLWQMARMTKNDQAPSAENVKAYMQYFYELPAEAQDEQAVAYRSEELLRQGHITASLDFSTEHLQEMADDPPFINFYKRHVAAVVESLLDLTATTTQSPEFISAYERLVELGESSLELHFCAIQNYADQGRERDALRLALKLERVAPNYPGLKETLRDLMQKRTFNTN